MTAGALRSPATSGGVCSDRSLAVGAVPHANRANRTHPLPPAVDGRLGALSAALKTEITFANTLAQQRKYSDFPVLRLREMPSQEIVVVDSDLGPFGAGESPVPAVYAAIGNALCTATGQRLRTMPFRLQAPIGSTSRTS